MGTGASVATADDQTTQPLETGADGAANRPSKPLTEYMDPIRSLIKSACSGDEEKMSLLLKQGLDPNAIESENSR